MRNQQGFTLIELLIVISILGILASIAAGSYINELPKYRLKDATLSLFGAIQKARIQAIRNGLPCTIKQNGNNLVITQSGSPTETFSLSNFQGVKFGSLNGTVPEGDSGTFTSDTLVLQPNGTANEANSFFLKNSTNPPDGTRIAVNNIGKPKIERWNGSAYN